MSHGNNCKCLTCDLIASGKSKEDAIREIKQKEQDCIDKFGFYVHIVQDQNIFDCHTHGMNDYDHLDFQIVFPLPSYIAHSLLSILAKRVIGGEKFKNNQIVDGVVSGFNVKLINAKEGERDVLRIIVPDKDANLEEEDLTGNFKFQYH